MPSFSSIRLPAMLVIAGMALSPAAFAQTQSGQRSPPGGTGSSGASGGHSGHDMSTMSMQQMMEHCHQMQGMNRATMNADAKRMADQCDQMMKSHGQHSSGQGAAGSAAGGSGQRR